MREVAAEERQDQVTGNTHLILAIAVMLLSVGIARSGMAIVASEKRLWYAGLAIGVCGVFGLALGVARMLT